MTCDVTPSADTLTMPDYSPFSGRTRTPGDVPIELARTRWTMRSGVGKGITADIYDVTTGRELRITRGDDLLESRLSRADDAALEARATEVRTLLEQKGWTPHE